MINFGDQIEVNLGRAAIKEELHSCEYGSYEDHIKSSDCHYCRGTGKGQFLKWRKGGVVCRFCDGVGLEETRQEPYDKGRLHIVELLERDKRKSRVCLQTEEEVNEFFVQACTGTFGLYHLSTLRRIYKQLAPFVDARTKARVTYGSLGH